MGAVHCRRVGGPDRFGWSGELRVTSLAWIGTELAIRRLDDVAAKVADFRKFAKFRWDHESADELDAMITRPRRKFDDDPIAALAEGQITADEARRRGVNVR